MSRALVIRKVLLSGWRVSSALIFLAAALACGSLLGLTVADVADHLQLSRDSGSMTSR